MGFFSELGCQPNTTFKADDYYIWLTSIVGMPDGVSRDLLLKDLHSLIFVPRVDHDENRAEGGKSLRLIFCQEYGGVLSFPLDAPCSMLELMISMAMDIEDKIMYDPDAGCRISEWFWQMVANCGLYVCTDERYGSGWNDSYVSIVVDRINQRIYAPDGRGGLFPLQHPQEDQRDVELWFQANAYFYEKYFE